MSARDEILSRIRNRRDSPSERPADFAEGVVFDDPREQFRQVLESIGGRCIESKSPLAADESLAAIEEYSSAAKTISLVPGVGRSTLELAAVDDPHDLQDVDFAVLPGKLAVAENAAIWVTDEDIRHRVLYFLPQHLALVVPAGNLVHNMHEAYEQVDPAACSFSAFIAGPSKTADIEQSLVIGAHGAKSLTVFLVERSPADDA